MDNGIFLSMKNISKTFPGVKALEDIQLEIRKGEVHALIGENGAGKSTLIKILSGVYQPDNNAEIIIEGEKTTISNPLISTRKGIAVIYQDFSLFPNLSVVENIGISLEIEKGSKKIDWKAMRAAARKAIDYIGLDVDLDIQVGKLSVAKQQLIAIARSLVYDAKMIIMDEPTSALSRSEVEQLFKIIRNLKKDNVSVVFVSHKLEELFEVADRFTVLRDGKYMGTYNKEELDNDRLISLMVGRKLSFERQKNYKQIGGPLLEVKNMSKRGNFKNISFTLHKGEIIGITGLVGAGRTEVIEAIFGIQKPDEGEILLENKKIEITSASDAVNYGIAYVPENRQTDGLVMRQSIENNLTITINDRLVEKLNIINTAHKRNTAKEWMQKLNVKPPILDMDVQQLSGGNQQRVVIAKWLATEPKVLIIDEPTNGIDVGAKSEIHNILRDLASKGIGIIMVSSELPEVLAVSDRILVMRKGRIVGEFNGDDATQEGIMNKAILSN